LTSIAGMETRYSVHGLRVTSPFPLAGTAQATADVELPALALRRRTASELERTWRPVERAPLWQGRLGDGRTLSLERGAHGESLFTYADRARYLLSTDMRTLDCAPADGGLDWERVLLGKILPSVSVMRGYEALHAAAVDSPRGVVAFMAASGGGKSTLAIELMRRGWPLFADDQLTLARADGAVLAYPGTAHMNVADDAETFREGDSIGETLDRVAGERWISARRSADRPRPVALLCLLERGPGRKLAARTLDSSPLSLAPYMLGLATDVERQRSRFNLFADLIDASALMHLTAGAEHAPDALADLVDRHVTGARKRVAASR
jgi:hypothetical protein